MGDRIYGATTDHAQNIRSALVDLMKIHHLGCRLTSVAWLLGRVKKLVKHFKRSHLLCDKQIL